MRESRMKGRKTILLQQRKVFHHLLLAFIDDFTSHYWSSDAQKKAVLGPFADKYCRLENVVEFNTLFPKISNDINTTLGRGDLQAIGIEYIQGRSLQQIIREAGCLPAEQSFHYAKGIFNGLIELREAGILHHRDIRPANIMIDEERDRAVI